MIYGRLAAVCGSSYEQIDRMTMIQYGELCEYWQQHPPHDVLLRVIAQSLGAKFKDPEAAQPERGATVSEIRARFPDGIWRG